MPPDDRRHHVRPPLPYPGSRDAGSNPGHLTAQHEGPDVDSREFLTCSLNVKDATQTLERPERPESQLGVGDATRPAPPTEQRFDHDGRRPVASKACCASLADSPTQVSGRQHRRASSIAMRQVLVDRRLDSPRRVHHGHALRFEPVECIHPEDVPAPGSPAASSAQGRRPRNPGRSPPPQRPARRPQGPTTFGKPFGASSLKPTSSPPAGDPGHASQSRRQARRGVSSGTAIRKTTGPAPRELAV